MLDGEDLHEDIKIPSEKISEEVELLVKQKLQNEKWSPKKVDSWTKDLIESILKMLAEMKKPYKYVVSCIIMQKNGAGLYSTAGSIWNETTDGRVNYIMADHEWLVCNTTVYWAKID
jgi:dynein light chain Tctex-type 1